MSFLETFYNYLIKPLVLLHLVVLSRKTIDSVGNKKQENDAQVERKQTEQTDCPVLRLVSSSLSFLFVSLVPSILYQCVYWFSWIQIKFNKLTWFFKQKKQTNKKIENANEKETTSETMYINIGNMYITMVDHNKPFSTIPAKKETDVSSSSESLHLEIHNFRSTQGHDMKKTMILYGALHDEVVTEPNACLFRFHALILTTGGKEYDLMSKDEKEQIIDVDNFFVDGNEINHTFITFCQMMIDPMNKMLQDNKNTSYTLSFIDHNFNFVEVKYDDETQGKVNKNWSLTFHENDYTLVN